MSLLLKQHIIIVIIIYFSNVWNIAVVFKIIFFWTPRQKTFVCLYAEFENSYNIDKMNGISCYSSLKLYTRLFSI